MRQNRTLVLVLILLTGLTGLTGLNGWGVQDAAADPPTGDPVLGTNLAFLRANSGEYPFVDGFKTATRWFSAFPTCFDCGTLNVVDGWVTSLATDQEAIAFLFQDNAGRYPAGDYTVLYTGVGTLEYEGSGRKHEILSSAGHDVVHVDPRQGELVLVLTSTDPNNPLKDIRVILPGGVCDNDPYQPCRGAGDPVCGTGVCELFEAYHATQIFHPTFLNNLRRFKVLRFMDWMDTIEGGFTDFADYPTLSSARWTAAPVEILAELGNRVGADLWVNVPHGADTNFIDQLAGGLAAGLDPGRKVWVEYSNEVWNPNFPAFMDVTLAGCAAYPALQCEAGVDPNDGVLCDGHRSAAWFPNCEEARVRLTSERMVHAWDRFELAFGGTSRLVRVMSSQSGEPQLHAGLLSWQNAFQDTDVLATAAYFGVPVGGDPAVAGWDLDTLFQALSGQEIQDTINLMKTDFYFLDANYPTVPLVHYEGGQHLQAFGAVSQDPYLEEQVNLLFEDANRDPRMGDLYDALFNAWEVSESPLFLHFTNVQAHQPWTRFGALEYQDQPHDQSVKYQALLRELDRLGVP